MRWYYSFAEMYLGQITNVDIQIYGAVGYPLKYGGVIYGTESNLMNYYSIHGNSFFQFYRMSRAGMSEEVDIPGGWRLVGTNSSSNWGTELPNDTISGKRKFSTTLTGNVYNTWCIPLNYSITKADDSVENYNYIRSAYDNNRTASINSCGFKFGNIDTGTLTTFGSSSAPYTIPSSYQNCVIDFGTTPQNVPKFIKDFIISNTTPVESYSISYHPNGGLPVPPNLIGQTKLPSPLPVVSKSNYMFDGWYYDEDFEDQANPNDVLTQNVSLYAKFTRISSVRKLYFKINGIEKLAEINGYNSGFVYFNGVEYEFDNNEVVPWDTPTISLSGDILSTDKVDGVTMYKVYQNGDEIGYIDEDNVWHSLS